jgi:hypothetical protein
MSPRLLLLRLHPNLRLLGALPRARLAPKPVVLARPEPRQLLRIAHGAVDPAVPDPQRDADDEAVLYELPDEPNPEHDGAVEHAEELEGEP